MRQASFGKTVDQTRTADSAGSGNGRRFVAAVVLARKGRYADASKLLQRALSAGECSEADALDLQARIYAQQGLYLHAESCWHRAKNLDRLNHAYDEALSRLRRARSSAGRLFLMGAVLSFTFALSLLLWQVMLVNPTIINRLNSTESSLTAVHGQIARFQEVLHGRDQDLVMSITSLGNRLSDLDLRLSQRLKMLPTAAGIAQEREAVITRIDEQIATLQKSFGSEITSLGTHIAEADIAQVKTIEAIEAAISEIGRVVMPLEGRLVKVIEAGDVGLSKRVGTMEASIQSDIEYLPTIGELVMLSQTVDRLQEQLAKIGVVLKQIRDASDQDAIGMAPDEHGDRPTNQ